VRTKAFITHAATTVAWSGREVCRSPPVTAAPTINFSFDRMLALTGNTGLTCSMRWCVIAGKSPAREATWRPPRRNAFQRTPEWGLVRELLKLDGVDAEVEERRLLPIASATYLFEAQPGVQPLLRPGARGSGRRTRPRSSRLASLQRLTAPTP